MLRYLLAQSLSFALTFVLVLTIVFFAMRLLPGDPASMRAGTEASQAQIQAIRRSMGLDRPLHVQFGQFWSDLARGDLGSSVRERRPVVTILLERLPVTVSLALGAFVLSLTIGVGLGLLAGQRPGSWGDRVTLGYTTLGLTLPEFWLGFLLLLFLAIRWPLFPLIGYPDQVDLGSLAHHLFLPALTLAIPRAAQIARLTRAQILEERGADYLRTAKSKGVPPPGLLRHTSANALPNLLPLVALELGGLLTGTIVVEQVFGLPGLGLAILGSISARDYPVVQGVTVLAVTIYVGVNWLADVTQALADPRIRYG